MPYINFEDRQYIDETISRIDGADVQEIANVLRSVPSGKAKGAFNYFVTRLWLNTFFKNGQGLSYTSLSDAIAVFRDMEKHLDDRLMKKYEEIAIDKNEDLPEFEVIGGILADKALDTMVRENQKMGLKEEL